MPKHKLTFALTLVLTGLVFLWFFDPKTDSITSPQVLSQQTNQPSPTPSPTPQTLPVSKILPTSYHIFQSFNNCGPASLSMALSYFDINKTQEELGQELRPYQNPQGDNDDKSVTLDELAKKGEGYGLIGFHRPNGNPELLKKFIALGVPVITRTWLEENEDIGHYRVVKGYDDTKGELIQDDSFQNKNLHYSYDNFNKIWEKFNYEYLVFVPKDKQAQADAILGEDIDPKTAWNNAAKLSRSQLAKNPDNIYARFNLSVAYYNIGEYQKSVEEFEKVEDKLPFRTLWYQIEPIKAYYELGNYDRVFSITDRVLNYYNKAYSEAYMLRGLSYLKLEDKESAKAEFEKAVFYNQNLKEANDLLSSVR